MVFLNDRFNADFYPGFTAPVKPFSEQKTLLKVIIV